MDRFLGFDDVELIDVEETHTAVRATVIVTDKPACPTCGPHGRMESKGKTITHPLVDTTSRGKPTRLIVVKRRYRCLVCKRSVTQAGPPVGTGPIKPGRKKVTGRLLRYIQNQVTKRPILQVAKETGVPVGTVRDIALELSDALEEHHRFPTPRILGMDGLKLNKTEYMVIGDADDGHVIGIVEPAKTVHVRKWMLKHAFDAGAVDVFVSDMHLVNKSLARNELARATHVADKWHIIHNFRPVLSRAVDIVVSDLRAGNPSQGIAQNLPLAQNIDDLKGAIMSMDHSRLRKRRRGKRLKIGEQGDLNLTFDRDLKPYLDLPSLDSVSRAYWARWELVMMYRCHQRAEAVEHFDRFMERIAPLLIDPRLGPDVVAYLKHISTNRKAVFAYFDWVRERPNGLVRGPTTNVLEQRNSMIRSIWRSGKGIKSLPLLRLRTVYHQWEIGADIVQCSASDCPKYHGPLIGPRLPLNKADQSTGWRCSTHVV